MGFGRDLGAALTMGLTVNTEHKQAQDEHKKRVAVHDRAVGAFNATYHQTGEKIQALEPILKLIEDCRGVAGRKAWVASRLGQ